VNRSADLHTHTSHSDGSLSPYELIKKCKARGLATIGITDHDSVNGLDEAVAIGKEFDVEVVPGIELSAVHRGMEIHILGYFIDYHNPEFLESLELFRGERLRRVERMVDKLNRMNIPLRLENVLTHAGNAAVGRPHVATALVNGGHVASYQQAFSKLIGEGRPAFERKNVFTPKQTIDFIESAGGLSFLAHPGRAVGEELVLEMIKDGMDGIEVAHPSHSPDLVQYYRGIVDEYCLLESGGSDFHGGLKNDDHLLGQCVVPAKCVEEMRRRLFS
jgi:predicted metal-dependent phosphoesterase TrpH